MATTHATPARAATLIDPQRTTAVWSIRGEVDELLEDLHLELEEWMEGCEHPELTIRSAREKLTSIRQRIDAMETLGPPSRPALRQLLREGND